MTQDVCLHLFASRDIYNLALSDIFAIIRTIKYQQQCDLKCSELCFWIITSWHRYNYHIITLSERYTFNDGHLVTRCVKKSSSVVSSKLLFIQFHHIGRFSYTIPSRCALLIHTDRVMSSRWLQMTWRQIGAKPSATTMLTRLWLHSHISYVAWHKYVSSNKRCSREGRRWATRWFIFLRIRLLSVITLYVTCKNTENRKYHDAKLSAPPVTINCC